MPIDLLINTADPQQRGLVASILEGGIAPFPNFTRNDASVAITLQPVKPSTTDTRSFDVDYTAGDTYQVSIGSADEAPTAGTFSLEIDGATTDLTSLDFDVSAEDLEDALSAASVAGGNPALTVTLLSEGVYQVDGATVGVIPTIEATATNLIPNCSAVVTVISQGTVSTKGQQIIALVQQPAAYATPSTALPAASVTASTEQAASSSANKIIRIAFASGTYGGLYSITATVNGVTAICGSVSPVASVGELSTVLGRHPQLRYNNPSAPNNFTVSTDGAAYLVEFNGNLIGPADPSLAVTNVSLLAPFGASGTISINTVNMAKMFWASGTTSLSLTLSVVRTRTSGEVKTILSIPVTVPADIINAGSLTTLSVSGAVRYDISQSLSASEKLQAVTNQGLNLTASKLLGQASTGGTGLPVAITLGSGLSMSGTTVSAVGTIPTGGAAFSMLQKTSATDYSVDWTNYTFSDSPGAFVISGTGTQLTFFNTCSVSGDNTGDQTSVTGNAGTATALATARNIFNISFNGTANVAGDATNTGHFASIPGTGAAGHFVTENGTAPTLIAGRSAWYSNGSGVPSFKNGTGPAVTLVRSSDLGTGIATFLTTPSSANLAAAVTDETGTGALQFATLAARSGTGGVARTIDAMIKEQAVSVKDYGATGDGTTDDTTAITNALAACISLGRNVLFFPAGTYKLTDEIVLGTGPENLTICGQNYSSKIVQTATNKDAFRLTGSHAATYDALTIRDLWISGPGAATSTKSGFTCEDVTETLDGALFQRVKVTGFKYGLKLWGCSNSKIDSCAASANWVGYYIANNGANFANSLHFVASPASDNTKYNIWVASGDCITFSSMDIVGTVGEVMLYVTGGYNILMDNARIEANSNDCIGLYVNSTNTGVTMLNSSIANYASATNVTSVRIGQAGSRLTMINSIVTSGGVRSDTYSGAIRYDTTISANILGFGSSQGTTVDCYTSGTTYYGTFGASEWETDMQSSGFAASSGTLGKIRRRVDTTGAESIKICVKTGTSSYALVDLAAAISTATANTFSATQTFGAINVNGTHAVGQGYKISLGYGTGADGGSLYYRAAGAGASRNSMLVSDWWALGDFNYMVAADTSAGTAPTRSRIYHDIANNRTSFGHDAASQPSGTKTLNVEGTLDATGIFTAGNIKRGAGTPEGAITGIVGDLYTRTDGGTNTTLYVKESGSGNTGWVAK